jgi:hypothetical protein
MIPNSFEILPVAPDNMQVFVDNNDAAGDKMKSLLKDSMIFMHGRTRPPLWIPVESANSLLVSRVPLEEFHFLGK